MKLNNIFIPLTLLMPVALHAYSAGPPIHLTGAAMDGGANCSMCHGSSAPANSDFRGSIRISAAPYTPGVKQTLKVTVVHPTQKRWGFQLIARLGDDETQQAGTFSTSDVIRVRCTNTQDAPCNGAPEFAEHSNAPFTGEGAGFTFLVDWTAPESYSGQVHFYAAGNAAVGDHSLTGDYIYTTRLFVPKAGPCSLTLKPIINSVVNSASLTSTISSSAMISIFGSNFNLAGTRSVPNEDKLAAGGFPRELSCAAVEVNGTRVPLVFAGEQQINAQVPANLSAGPATVRVVLNPDAANQLSSDTTVVLAANVSPSLFQIDSHTVAATDASGAPIGVSAKPGEMVTFWATGLGSTDHAVPEGEIVSERANVKGTVAVIIGGIHVAPIDIGYAGLSPHAISGIYQINARIPAGLPDGNASVVVQVDGASTQAGLTIPIKRVNF